MTTINLNINISHEAFACLIAALANAERSVPPALLRHAHPLLEQIEQAAAAASQEVW